MWRNSNRYSQFTCIEVQKWKVESDWDHSAQSGIKVINVIFTKLIDIEMNQRYGTDYNFQILCMS